jgi:hypothetical protein
MGVVGAAFVYWASTTSSFAVYSALVARSRLLWGDNVHRFYQVVGVIVVVLGVLWATGVIWSNT